MHQIALLGTGLVGNFYTMALQGKRRRDQIHVAYSRTETHAKEFATKWNVPNWTTDLQEAINNPEVGVVIVALPNHLHKDAVVAAARAGKAVLCTKPLGRTADEALVMLQAVEEAGVFHGYLEDLVYTPKTLRALESVRAGAIGKVLWVRSRETHSGPHSDWFWDPAQSGGGAVIDMGCHCIEIGRSFIGKHVRPVEVVCWTDTQVHPVEVEDHAIGMVRYSNGAIGQFEVSWAFRGGMDLRDEVAGSNGTIWLNHWLRTGFDLFTSEGHGGYVTEKSEANQGWLFPVADEPSALGYVDMFTDMLDSLDNDTRPVESFFDGYVVNAIMDACYESVRSKRWESIELARWVDEVQTPDDSSHHDYDSEHELIKREKMPDGSTKLILRNKQSGKVIQRIQT